MYYSCYKRLRFIDCSFRSGLVQDYKGKDKPKLLPHIFKKIVDKIGECVLIIVKLIPVLCDELFHKFIHRREQSKFASSRYPLLCLGNDFENI